VKPELIPGVVAGVQNNTYDSAPKDEYDAFTFQIKEQLEVDSTAEQEPDRAQMLSITTALAMGYHDGISKTTDASHDAALNTKYKENVESEKLKNAGWSQSVKDSFARRTDIIGSTIERSSSEIRAFYMRNRPISAGVLISQGITTYSGPISDFDTLLDIKPSQRPPELIAFWSKKYNIAEQERSRTQRKLKFGTLNYSDAFNGKYGPLISDKTCSSTRFPGGSIIALRKKDGTVYDPTGKNPSGQYKVTDIGSNLTYNKPDIFTLTPALYVNTESVQVFLISDGTRKQA
jgi:hypothetical protein